MHRNQTTVCTRRRPRPCIAAYSRLHCRTSPSQTWPRHRTEPVLRSASALSRERRDGVRSVLPIGSFETARRESLLDRRRPSRRFQLVVEFRNSGIVAGWENRAPARLPAFRTSHPEIDGIFVCCGQIYRNSLLEVQIKRTTGGTVPTDRSGHLIGLQAIGKPSQPMFAGRENRFTRQFSLPLMQKTMDFSLLEFLNRIPERCG